MADGANDLILPVHFFGMIDLGTIIERKNQRSCNHIDEKNTKQCVAAAGKDFL